LQHHVDVHSVLATPIAAALHGKVLSVSINGTVALAPSIAVLAMLIESQFYKLLATRETI
jgi:hypothetical protein